MSQEHLHSDRKFTIKKDPVLYFFSNMGNSGVPYEVMVTPSRFIMNRFEVDRSENGFADDPRDWDRDDVEELWSCAEKKNGNETRRMITQYVFGGE